MKQLKRMIRRFIFAWHYAYETDKWRSFETYVTKDVRCPTPITTKQSKEKYED